jgi:hypothetical protein
MTKPQDVYLRGIKAPETGPATVSGWLKRRSDAKRADTFPESPVPLASRDYRPTTDAKRR